MHALECIWSHTRVGSHSRTIATPPLLSSLPCLSPPIQPQDIQGETWKGKANPMIRLLGGALAHHTGHADERQIPQGGQGRHSFLSGAFPHRPFAPGRTPADQTF